MKVRPAQLDKIVPGLMTQVIYQHIGCLLNLEELSNFATTIECQTPVSKSKRQ